MSQGDQPYKPSEGGGNDDRIDDRVTLSPTRVETRGVSCRGRVLPAENGTYMPTALGKERLRVEWQLIGYRKEKFDGQIQEW